MRQIALPLPHETAMGADDFLVTPCNRDAAKWIAKWPDWPAHGMIVTGAAGSGKTHLLNLWLRRSKGHAIGRDELTSPEMLDPASAYAVDNADGIAGDATAEEGLFHLYNAVKAAKGFLLLTMTRGAGQAEFALPDLRSRLLTLPSAALGAPDDALLEALIVKQFRDRQVTPDVGVVPYLAARIARDAAAIRDLVERIDRASLASGRKISIVLARAILDEINMESKDE
ncbi:MAG: DNA replication protein [Alphaproteobacteria bacterium]|nr:DNA replication protein [Alphaproteobacteria bacterium]